MGVQVNAMVAGDTVQPWKLLKELLRSRGYRVLCLPEGKRASEAALKQPPDLILLDLSLSGIGGHSACARLETDERLSGIPIILVSGWDETPDEGPPFQFDRGCAARPRQPEEAPTRAAPHGPRPAKQAAERRAKALGARAPRRRPEPAGGEEGCWEVAAALSLAEQRGRQQLAMELHDRVSQPIAFARMKLTALQREVASSELARQLSEIGDLLEEGAREARSLIHEADASAVQDTNLAAELERLGEQFAARHGLRVSVEADVGRARLDAELRGLVFRTVRELMVNAAKHARASRVHVYLHQCRGELAIEVDDDGVGFEVPEMWSRRGPAAGHGLRSLRERFARLGGRLGVASEVGGGTQVYVAVPIAARPGG